VGNGDFGVDRSAASCRRDLHQCPATAAPQQARQQVVGLAVWDCSLLVVLRVLDEQRLHGIPHCAIHDRQLGTLVA
jgi:hypothetical protein